MNRGRCVVWNKVPVKFDDGCETSTQSHFSTAIHTRGVIPSRWFLLAYTGFQYASESSTRRRCLCGSVYTMQPLATWLTCVCRPSPCVVTSNCVPRRLGLCWSACPDCYWSLSAQTWTSLPADLRTPDTTLCSFKRHLKAHLFQR